MSDSTPIENEINSDTVDFDYFGRTWTVPTKRHLSHLKKMRDEMRGGVGTVDLMIAETFLPDDQFEALLELDPDEAALDKFTQRISEVMGLGTSGNSSPSSASS